MPALDLRPPARTRDRDRRSKIMSAATHLFRQRGFHAVGIDEIGTAAGISGPGVYRHFAGKDELLARVVEQVTLGLWPEVDDGVALEQHVRAQVAYAVDHGEAIELWYREHRNLPDAHRAASRRAQRLHVDRWVAALQERRPALDEGEARIRVRAVLGLLHSTSRWERLGDPAVVAPVLEQLALSALLAEGGGKPS